MKCVNIRYQVSNPFYQDTIPTEDKKMNSYKCRGSMYWTFLLEQCKIFDNEVLMVSPLRNQ